MNHQRDLTGYYRRIFLSYYSGLIYLCFRYNVYMLNEPIPIQPTSCCISGKAINMQTVKMEAGRTRDTLVIEGIIKNKPDSGFRFMTEDFKCTSENKTHHSKAKMQRLVDLSNPQGY